MFKFRLQDISTEKRKEIMDIFIKRQQAREALGGCPHKDDRVVGHTNCFNCDDCWIAAIDNSFLNDYVHIANGNSDKLQALVNIIADQLEIDKEYITKETVLKDIGVDSLDVVEIIMSIEDVFDIKIADKEMPETVDDLLALI